MQFLLIKLLLLLHCQTSTFPHYIACLTVVCLKYKLTIHYIIGRKKF